MRRRIVALLACVASSACSGGDAPSSPPAEVRPEAPAPSAVVEAPPSSVVVSPSEVAPAPTDAPTTLASTTDARHVRGRWVPVLDVEDVVLPTVSTVHVHHPNATVRDRLTTLIDEDSTRFAVSVSADAEADNGGPADVRCHATAATRTLVGLLCRATWYPDARGAFETTTAAAFAYEIVGEEVRPTSAQAALVPDAHCDGPFEAARQRELDEHGSEYEFSPDRDTWGVDATALGHDGLHVAWIDGYYGLLLEATVPYADVLDQLRSDGPVARMLRLGAFAASATPPPSEAPAGALRPTGPWRMGTAVPTPEALLRWASLPAPLRPAVGVITADGLTSLAVRESVDLETAQRIATTLGGRLEAIAPGTELRIPSLRTANGSVNVRDEGSATGGWLGTLPRGALVVTLGDATDRWIYAIAAPGLEGYASSRYLDPDAACAPDAAGALALVPAEDREAATRTMLRLRDVAMQNGRYAPAALFVSTAGTHSYVSLHALSPSTCRLGATLAHWTLDGAVVDALVTRTAQRGGETLVLAQVTGAWVALRVGAERPIWQEVGFRLPSEGNDLVAPALRGPSGRGFWPLALRRPGEPIRTFRWDAAQRALVEDAPQ